MVSTLNEKLTFDPMFLAEMTWSSVDRLSRDCPIIIPVAAVEQHGHHLPLSTDSILLGEVVRRVEASVSQRALFAPVMWLGNSHHHLDFSGTLSAAPRCYLDMLLGLMQNFLFHGFRRLLLLNGHGGNDVPGKQAVFEVRQQYRDRSDILLLLGTYWSLGSSSSEFLDQFELGEFRQIEMGHACEWETSMMLRIAPELVGDFARAGAVEPGNPFRPANRGWITKERSEPGHIGWPEQASADKGEFLLSHFSRDVIKMIDRMEQWDGSTWEG